MDSTYLSERITKTKEIITAYEDAILFLTANPAKTYRLDTGQSVQSVTIDDMNKIQDSLDILYNRLVVFEARLSGNNVLVAGALW